MYGGGQAGGGQQKGKFVGEGGCCSNAVHLLLQESVLQLLSSLAA